jgi:GNAT superfamily N-acetyltransferase
MRLILLPGMGVDSRLHASLAAAVPGVVSANWIDHRGCDGLADYASRLTAQLGITATDAVGGSSLGGMVAAEIHRQVGCRGLALIGSCDDPRFIRPPLRRLTWFGERLPFSAVIKLLGPLQHASMLINMLRDSDGDFLRWACGALSRWDGARAAPGTAWRIHGRRDLLITARGQMIDRLVGNGGHVLALSHPHVVAAFLKRAPWWRLEHGTKIQKDIVPGVRIRLLAATDAFIDLTDLLHRAYASLGELGLNYTAIDQSAEVTEQRIHGGTCYVAELDSVLVGTIVVHPSSASSECRYFRRASVASAHQFAVDPAHQGRGIGRGLLHQAEMFAKQRGFAELALDTAEPATHLVAFYHRLGYQDVDLVQWPGKTYRSVVLSKKL